MDKLHGLGGYSAARHTVRMDQPVAASKYARIERERRWLLSELPEGIQRGALHRALYDRYLIGTRFRLRRIVPSDGGEHTYKLTQKYQHLSGELARVTITNTYLTAQEYATFADLPAHELWKDRYRYAQHGHTYAIDVFGVALAGLILAEREFRTDAELQTFASPPFARAEVTNDPVFTGGRLCRVTWADLRIYLAQQFNVDPEADPSQ